MKLTLTVPANDGANAFYTGTVVSNVVAANLPGYMTLVDVPVQRMFNKEYLSSRAALTEVHGIDTGTVSPDVPPGVVLNETAADARAKLTGRSHFSIVDRYGNTLYLTSRIEAPFGNGVMVHGFLLNNELTDYSVMSGGCGGNPYLLPTESSPINVRAVPCRPQLCLMRTVR